MRPANRRSNFSAPVTRRLRSYHRWLSAVETRIEPLALSRNLLGLFGIAIRIIKDGDSDSRACRSRAKQNFHVCRLGAASSWRELSLEHRILSAAAELPEVTVGPIHTNVVHTVDEIGKLPRILNDVPRFYRVVPTDIPTTCSKCISGERRPSGFVFEEIVSRLKPDDEFISCRVQRTRNKELIGKRARRTDAALLLGEQRRIDQIPPQVHEFQVAQ